MLLELYLNSKNNWFGSDFIITFRVSITQPGLTEFLTKCYFEQNAFFIFFLTISVYEPAPENSLVDYNNHCLTLRLSHKKAVSRRRTHQQFSLTVSQGLEKSEIELYLDST